jgi:hypothetical protein
LGEKWISNVSPLLREAKDTAIGDTMYDKGRSCEYLFLTRMLMVFTIVADGILMVGKNALKK